MQSVNGIDWELIEEMRKYHLRILGISETSGEVAVPETLKTTTQSTRE